MQMAHEEERVDESAGATEIAILDRIARHVLWLSTAMVHHANNVRPNLDGAKVGGHQASSASSVGIMTALYFDFLREGDRIAVKPHASPAFHAIQYLPLQQLEDEGLITAAAVGDEDRRRNYTLTDEGRAYVEAHADELRAAWDAVTGSVDDAAVQMHNLARNVAMATVQVAQAGSPAQIQQASKVLADTRKALYRILAADDEAAEQDA